MVNAQPCAEKIFINLNSPPAFQLRQKILGDNNTNLSYIGQETKATVSLKGRGSGFIEQNGIESNEALHILIEHPALKNLIEAKNLAKNLIETIQQDLQSFLQQSQPQTVQIQPPPPIIQTSNQQITIPQSVLSCPPPTIIQQPIIQQQNFIPQHQIIPHNVPMQIIQQTPPPRNAAPIVHFQGQNMHPTNIQIQSGGQQILLNQAPTQQYQLQYIPSTNQITNAPQMQTIQHVIQPQQQIQGIIQPGANGQQFIVQGNTAFMIPPPNIIQQNSQQNINQQLYNSPPAIALNQEDAKNDLNKVKQEPGTEQKSHQSMQQMGARIVTNLPIPINQPPPILNCPPPQIFNQQGQQQQIQQFIVNANAWPQQQLQQLPINSQIQIVTQPQTIRSGNEIVIQNPIHQQGGQQVITTFNPQSGGQQFQQIQFHQAAISQPPPQQTQLQNVQPNHQNISFQQQFEQKINSCGDNQQRSGKRKFENEADAESSKMFPKMGMGQNPSDRSSSPKAKNRMMAPSQQSNQQPQKMNVNSAGLGGVSVGDKRNIHINPAFNRNAQQTMTNPSAIQKNVTTTAESKMIKPTGKNENESTEMNETLAQFTMQNHPSQGTGFMVRSGNQNYRFAGPQNFIHQQPPPISQSSQFNGQRGQIMSNSNMNMYQSVGQNQMMQQPPPPVVTTATHQFVQQDMNVYQANNNFHVNNQQGNMSRFNVPQQQQQQQHQSQQHQQSGSMGGENNSGMMTGSYQQQQQQQPRFRQW